MEYSFLTIIFIKKYLLLFPQIIVIYNIFCPIAAVSNDDTDNNIHAFNYPDVTCNFSVVIPEGCFIQKFNPSVNRTQNTAVDFKVLDFYFTDEIDKKENGEHGFCKFREVEKFPPNCIAQNKNFSFADYIHCPVPDVVEFDAPVLWINDTIFPSSNVTYRRDTIGLIMNCYSKQVLQLRTDEQIQFSGIGFKQSRRLTQKSLNTKHNNVITSNNSLSTEPEAESLNLIEVKIPKSLKSGTFQGNTGNYTLYFRDRENKNEEVVAKTFRLIIHDAMEKSDETRESQNVMEFNNRPNEIVCTASSNEQLYVASIGGENPLETRILSRCLEKETLCELKTVGKVCFQHRPCATLLRKDLTPDGIIFCSNRYGNITQEYFTDLEVYFNTDDPHNVRSDVLIQLHEDDGKALRNYVEPDYDYDNPDAPPTKEKEVITVYDKQIRNFECHYISYVLVPSIIWKVHFQNESSVEVHETPSDSKDIHPEIIEDANIQVTVNIKSAKFGLQITKGMQEISCGAEYWDSPILVESFISLNVLDSKSPSFSNSSTNQFDFTVDAGDNIVLNCKPEISDPPPTYEWEFNGKKLNSDENCIKILNDPSMRSSNVSICNAGKSHVGTFTCRARNFLGFDETEFQVKVTSSNTSRTPWIYFGIACSLIALLLPIILVLYRVYLTQRSRLSAMEIAAFENGDEKELRKSRYGHENAQFLPYNRDYEVEWKCFETEDDNLLGEGAYGIVLRGKVNGRLVAAKTVRSTAEKSEVLALLSELKIMIYLGKHPNIVELVGACTSMLRQGLPYVFIEFCENGDFHTFLVECRPYFLSQTNGEALNQSMYANAVANHNFSHTYSNSMNGDEREISEDEGSIRTTINKGNAQRSFYQNARSTVMHKNRKVSILDLVNWASDIANGMEYLESKKVIHGDLATRNVLLTASFAIKITDFGLSRQLQKNYSQYVKKQQAALPWPWMAIESLFDMVFTSKSDVWSFGVTLWEMFALAEVPYPGHNWTQEFMHQLRNGLRPTKPQYANAHIYQIMKDCWHPDPQKRPSFTQLKNAFANLIEDGQVTL